MGVRPLVAISVIIMLAGCSWTHHVRLWNQSEQAVAIVYKLACPEGVRCFFTDSAVVKPSGEQDPANWTVHRLDRSDSTMRFTLPPGHTADLATGWNTTYKYIQENPGPGPPHDNLLWMQVTGPSGTRRYSAKEFIAASDTRRSGVTLLKVTK